MKVFRVDWQNAKETERVVAALSCKTRQDILRLLQKENLSVWQIAEALGTPVSTVSTHLKVLANAGLLTMKLKPNSRGGEKLVIREYDEIVFETGRIADADSERLYTVRLPIGSYSDISVSDRCGMADENGFVIPTDTPEAFCSPNRYRAQLIWFTFGSIEYKVPLYETKGKTVTSVSFSLELCSEVANYNNDWKSDITFWINDVELCTYTSPGDFGGRRGRLTPLWWTDDSTQYGMMKNIKVDSSGSYIDETLASGKNIAALNLAEKEYFTLKIGIKKDAANVGGINLFGAKFGDYVQHITVNIAAKGDEDFHGG